MILEAKCLTCDETFNPHGEAPEDLEHQVKADGTDCGGLGELLGHWVQSGDASDSQVLLDDVAEPAHPMDDPAIKLWRVTITITRHVPADTGVDAIEAVTRELRGPDPRKVLGVTDVHASLMEQETQQ